MLLMHLAVSPDVIHRPYCLVGSGEALVEKLPPAFGKVPRARGTPGVLIGPTDLDTSQHRGVLKSE